MNLKKLLTSAVLSISLCQSAFAAPVEIDKVIGVVNEGVILKSEVDTIINRVKKQAEEQSQQLPKDETLRVQAIERLVSQTLMMQMAERMGLEISDSQLDQTLANMAKEQGGTIADLRRTIEGAGESFQAYREEIRKEITTQQVTRANVDRRIYISEQEVDNLLNQEFKRIAISSSSGSKALEGGQLGWMGINEMPSLFAEAVKGKKSGAIVGPLRSGAGFHIIKVQEIRGRQVVETTEVRSRHILIKPSIILSEEKARNMLAGFAKDLRAGTADFGELAKEYSEDPGSALKGGEYDWTDPTTYVPAFKDTLLSLKQDEISEPFRTQFGWHIVQLLGKRVADKTEQAKRNRAHGMLFNRKFKEESFNWQQEMREQAHVDIFPADQ